MGQPGVLCRVWCPTRQTMVHLNAIPNGNIADSRMFVPSALPEGGDLSFLGAQKPDDVSCAIAAGRIDPMTHKPFVVTVVDGIVHVAPPEQELINQHPRVTAPATVRSTQMLGRQPTEIVSLFHKSNGMILQLALLEHTSVLHHTDCWFQKKCAIACFFIHSSVAGDVGRPRVCQQMVPCR